MASYYYRLLCAGSALPINRTQTANTSHYRITFWTIELALRLRRSPSFLFALAKWKRNRLLCLHSSVSSMCTLAVCSWIPFILYSLAWKIFYCSVAQLSYLYLQSERWDCVRFELWEVFVCRHKCGYDFTTLRSYFTRAAGKLHGKLRENKLFELNNNVVRSNNLI